MPETDKFLIMRDASLKEAMKQINEVGEKVLFVVDEKRKLLGSLTDGDIRRWILKEGRLKGEIDSIYYRNPVVVSTDYTDEEVKRLMLENKIEWIPVMKADNEVVDVLLWDNVFGDGILVPKDELDVPVVIMAGGKGTRLDPFTRVLPKPLIPIGEKAIIDIILDKFSQHGVNEFFISINHKAKMIKSYFEEMATQYTIHYIVEEVPLGTAGCLKFLKDRIDDSVLVSNCDILIDCDYSEIVKFHNKNNYDISIVGSFRHFIIPYGICEIENGGVLTNITEKPEYDFLVNTGMYVLRKKTFDLIPENQRFHITDLVKSVKDKGGKVGVFPISEKSWIDIGQWDEYRKSLKLLGLE